MHRKFHGLLLLFLGVLAAGLTPAFSAEVNTAHLTVSDPSGKIPQDRLAQRAQRIEGLFAKVMALWETEAREVQYGKIRVVLLAQGRDLQLSVFRMVRDGNAMVREVLAAPPGGEPQMLAHKLTSAVFPSKDKLVRNMMGEVSEQRLGNPRTFPDCGLSADVWVLALLRLGLYLPLAELGPDHGSWGMGENEKGVPFTRDPDRHHRAYAEAASFGVYLFDTYGMAKLKEFCRQTGDTGRPWEAVYGAGLDVLEAQWLDALRSKESGLEPDVARAADLYRQDPATACDLAQSARP